MQYKTMVQLKSDEMVDILLRKHLQRVTEFLPLKFQTRKYRNSDEYKEQVRVWVEDVLLDFELPAIPVESKEAEVEFEIIAVQVSSLMFEAYYA